MHQPRRLLVVCLPFTLIACDIADNDEQEAVDDSAPIIAPAHCPSYSTSKNLYFGDLHTHTSYSLDAYTFGTRTEPARAYAFARGEAVYIDGADGLRGGPWTRIDRPLDFLA